MERQDAEHGATNDGAPRSASPIAPLPIEEFDYELPKELVAQSPVAERDQSRLLIVNRATDSLAHHVFRELPQLLRAGDLLVLNDSRVLVARLLGLRARTGGKWEGLFLRDVEPGVWELLCQTRGRLLTGENIVVGEGPLQLEVVRQLPNKHWLVKPNLPEPTVDLLNQYGHVPIPPYVRKGQDKPIDRERYQTVYAQAPGSVAAPTAGLHFTPELLDRLRGQGIATATVTLHVGLGTFQPIQVEDVRQHAMHEEWCTLSEATVAAIETCKAQGGRVIAVGTTSLRVLESAAQRGPLEAWSGTTNLFVQPGFPFQVVDGLLTNFHLPRSTLLVLVSAFAGMELTRRAYQLAIQQGYRFYSYGDAMLIL